MHQLNCRVSRKSLVLTNTSLPPMTERRKSLFNHFLESFRARLGRLVQSCDCYLERARTAARELLCPPPPAALPAAPRPVSAAVNGQPKQQGFHHSLYLWHLLIRAKVIDKSLVWHYLLLSYLLISVVWEVFVRKSVLTILSKYLIPCSNLILLGCYLHEFKSLLIYQ